MAATIAVLSKEDVGKSQVVEADVTLDNSYVTGGYAVTAADFGFRVGFLRSLVLADAGGYVLKYVPDTTLEDRGKVKAYQEAGIAGVLAEVSAATDLSAVKSRGVARGR